MTLTNTRLGLGVGVIGLICATGLWAQATNPYEHGPSISGPASLSHAPLNAPLPQIAPVAAPSVLPQPQPLAPQTPLQLDLPPVAQPTRLQTTQAARPAREYQSSPERQQASVRDFGPYAGPFREKLAAKMMEDFGEQYIYAPQNAVLPKPAVSEKRVVFIGDSITDKWELAKFFPGKPYVNRGIGSQITPQMLVRFHADVIALKPKAVVIAAGINDVTGLLQIQSEDQIKANYQAMAELASAHGIKVIFGSILPVNNYTENARGMLNDRKPETLKRLNAWLKAYCARMGFGFIDYTKALSDTSGLMRAEFTSDGLHPNETAYAVMAPIARHTIDAVLTPPPPAATPLAQTVPPAPAAN